MANRLRLLLYSRELLGEVLDRVAKEAGLGHAGIKEPDFVGIPHVGQTQPEMAFLDHQSGHRTAHCPRRNLRRPKREVRDELVGHDHPRAGLSVPWPDGPATTP